MMIGYAINLRESDGHRPRKRIWPEDGKLCYQGGAVIQVNIHNDSGWPLCDRFRIHRIDDRERVIWARKLPNPKIPRYEDY